MIIKKYQASSESDAIGLAKKELGQDVIIMNVKKIEPRGMYRFFRKSKVELTAAVEDNKPYLSNKKMSEIKKSSQIRVSDDSQTKSLEEKMNSLQKLIENQIEMKKSEALEEKKVLENKSEEEKINRSRVVKDKGKENVSENCIQLIKKQLIEHEVEEKYVDLIIKEVKENLMIGAPVDNILTAIYQKIVLKLGQSEIIEIDDECPKYIFFMGPTGVGKTTTIAKIASDFKLNKKMNIALLTSDTYRIAAVEQLKIYANILKMPLYVVYTAEEIENIKSELEQYDVVLIDTAGRSHKNIEQRKDLRKIINSVSEDNRVEYLVLSATTKYSDLVNIVHTYSDIKNYKIIFTKLDETLNLGNILNVKMLTNAQLSYVTFGQDVPNDIGKLDAQSIAKQLLGGEYGTGSSN